MPGGWPLDVALVCGLITVTVALAAKTPLLSLDVMVANWCDAHRPTAGYWLARVLNVVGQGSPLALLTLVLASWRTFRYRSVRPLLVFVVSYVMIYLFVGPVKLISDRAAPHEATLEHPEWLLSSVAGMSYPSGHVVNAVVWYTALAILLGGWLPRWLWTVLRTVPVVLVAGTTTYLGYHWLSDGLAGVLIGLLIARILLRVDWDAAPLGGRLAGSGWDRPVGLGAAVD
ncbi:MAG: phosphatase PAP2 family protein, partial [Dactylosporangium sp.]|nr:phosphatase PAP2 family protein [Dactylosporangium sp.]NNJ61472.1 phosphatase PAP2 family protein [Dactylosporangium sp.]